eukprot:SAG31_NODE_5288_length_2630_cov_2.811537_2_plen_74_part_00
MISNASGVCPGFEFGTTQVDVLPTGLKFKLPPANEVADASASDYAAYDVSVDGSPSLPLNTPDSESPCKAHRN